MFDGRCMNIMNQYLNQNHEMYVLGVGLKAEKTTYKNAIIELIDKKYILLQYSDQSENSKKSTRDFWVNLSNIDRSCGCN